MTAFLRELWTRDPVLAATAAGHLLLFFGFAALALADHTEILGVNRWLKPMKFAISIAIYLATMAWLLGELSLPALTRALLQWGLAGTMVVEMLLIAVQAARGVTSHFNVSTPTDGAIFGIMGTAIALSSLLVAGVALAYFIHPPNLPSSYLWGIRWGILIFLLASAQGAAMVSRLQHSVGGPDGGPGVPILNWSTRYGDLRVTHFLGLHALQMLPLLGYVVSRSPNAPGAGASVHAAALALLAAVLFTFFQAMRGIPLIRAGL